MRMSRVSQILPISAAYFFILAGQFVFTYLPRYLTSVGWSATSAGMLFAGFAVSRSISMPAWGIVADRRHMHLRLTRALALASIPALAAIGFVKVDWAFSAALILLGLTAGAVLPLLDTHTIHKHGAERFGPTRMWGSVGFGIAAIGFGIVGWRLGHAELAGLSPLVFFVLMTAGAMSIQFARGARHVESDSVSQEGTTKWVPLVLLGTLWFLHWMSQAPYNLFLVFLCEEKRFPAYVPGLAVAAGILVEVVIMRFGTRFIRKTGYHLVFAATVGLTMLRWVFSAQATSPMMLIALQTIHGLSFGAYFLCIMEALDAFVAPRHRGTAQSLLYVVVFGLGAAAGNGISGWVVDHSDTVTLFTAAGGLEFAVFLGAVVAMVSSRMKR